MLDVLNQEPHSAEMIDNCQSSAELKDAINYIVRTNMAEGQALELLSKISVKAKKLGQSQLIHQCLELKSRY